MVEAAPRRVARRRRAGLTLSTILLLLAIVPPLINLGRYQRRIAGAISRSIARPVSMDSVSLRLLPWPAFTIENLAVGEDPGFGAEPALRAPEVIAEPRLSSLWRGRFELARVEIADASVNLVRNSDGRWNVSSVLLQASHVSNAPTGQPHAGPAPRFPYIEATGTRINLKRGVEKLPYSLLDADFSMSLASPEVWHVKLEGEPVRTDLEMFANDTGVLRIEGDLHRASAFGAMPVKLDAEWSRASLGQLSRLALGRDTGWRGDIDATAQISGSLDRLFVRTHFAVANLHRQEFTPERAFTVDASCRGVYSRSTPATDAFRCRWPLGAGGLLLTGSAAGAADTEFQLGVDRVPADVLAAAVELLHQGGPEPGQFSGELSGSYTYVPARGSWTGAAAMPRLTVAQTGGEKAPLVVTGVRLFAPEPALEAPHRKPGVQPASASLLFDSDPISLGVPGQPMAVSATLTGRGYRVEANGAGTLARVQSIAAMFGFGGFPRLASSPVAKKPAGVRLELTGFGPWLGGSAVVAGSAHLANVRWQPSWLPFPVDLPSADAVLSPELLSWTVSDAAAGMETGSMHFAGSARMPLACAAQLLCTTRFALNTPSLDAGGLQAALTGGRPELLQELLRRFNASRVPLPALAGTIHAGVLTLGRLPVRNATAVLSTGTAPGPAVEFQSLDGSALGGALHLQGTLSLAGATPKYRIRGSLTGASAAQAADLWGESWGPPPTPGTLGGAFNIRLQGGTLEELLASAQGTFQASWLHGAPAPPLFRFEVWEGAGTITGSGLHIDHSTFAGNAATGTENPEITGTIGWDRSLALQISGTNGAAPGNITGTLAQPAVQPPTASPAEGAATE